MSKMAPSDSSSPEGTTTDSALLAYCTARERLRRAEVASKEERAEQLDAERTLRGLLTDSMQRHAVSCMTVPGPGDGTARYVRLSAATRRVATARAASSSTPLRWSCGACLATGSPTLPFGSSSFGSRTAHRLRPGTRTGRCCTRSSSPRCPTRRSPPRPPRREGCGGARSPSRAIVRAAVAARTRALPL